MVDILAFGAHPDDVEVGVGGILAKHSANGYRVAICNLTEAELSSNGTVATRRDETQKAAMILGIHHLVNLGFPDRGLCGGRDQIDPIVRVIRTLRPRVILAPHEEDRHPDHVACHRLVREATFDAAIKKRVVDQAPATHRVSAVFHYFINNTTEPSLVVDISDVYDQKMEAMLAYQSQFQRGSHTVQTPLNSSSFLSMIKGRDQAFGHQVGCQYGEALISPKPLLQQWLPL